MGSCYSRVEKQDTVVSRYKARRRYAKHLVKARHGCSAAHALHLRSLRATGSALLHLANSETLHQTHHSHSHHLPSQPLSPSSETHTSITASPFLPPPPPPPPPPSSWDFWDPFAPSSSTSVTDEEWETTTEAAAITAPPPPPSSSSRPPSVISKGSNSASDLAMVVSRTSCKDFVEIVKELDEYFVKAADVGSRVSAILEVPVSGFSNQSRTGKSFLPLGWSWGSNSCGFERLSEEVGGGDGVKISHCGTLEKVYAWEKKLYLEVKNAESIKMDLEKRVVLLRKQEAKGVDYVKIEKNRKEIARLESRLMVANQAMETTSTEINRLREAELFPQLLDLLNGLMCMWRRMYECHQVQTHIVEQLKFLNNIDLGTKPTSEILKQSTLQLEHEVNQWHSSFCTLIKSQRDYIHSFTGWLRLSLFLCSNNNPLANTKRNSPIYSLCEEWQLALDRIPDKVASEGIKSFLTVIHAVVIQQVEEHKQKKRSEAAFKKLEKRVAGLRSLELKHGSHEISVPASYRSRLLKKRAEVDSLRSMAEDEKTKYDKCAGVTRAMTLNSLQTGLPNVFQAITGFSSVYMHALESVYNQPMNSNMDHDLSKRLLTE